MANNQMKTLTLKTQDGTETFEIVDEVARNKKFTVTSEDDGDGHVTIVEGTDGGGTTLTSYMSLTDKPKLEGVVMAGEMTLEDYNLKRLSNTELEAMLKED